MGNKFFQYVSKLLELTNLITYPPHKVEAAHKVKLETLIIQAQMLNLHIKRVISWKVVQSTILKAEKVEVMGHFLTYSEWIALMLAWLTWKYTGNNVTYIGQNPLKKMFIRIGFIHIKSEYKRITSIYLFFTLFKRLAYKDTDTGEGDHDSELFPCPQRAFSLFSISDIVYCFFSVQVLLQINTHTHIHSNQDGLISSRTVFNT